MKTRIISAFVGIALLIAILAIGTPVLQIAVTLLAMLGVYELLSAVKLADNKSLLAISVVAAIGLTVSAAYSLTLILPAVYIWLAFVFIYYMAKRQSITLKEIATVFLLTLYPCFLFGHLLHIYSMDNGRVLIWSVLVCAFVTDTCAMFGGKFFGKHRLCPKLSPKKTVEGSFFGVVGCVLGMLIYCLICSWTVKLTPDYANAIVIALGASVVSQLGDLAASCIKREFGIKDYGNIMPGHGGVMDRFDSLLFVSPFICYTLIIFPIF